MQRLKGKKLARKRSRKKKVRNERGQPQHKREFEQLLDDAIFGVKPK